MPLNFYKESYGIALCRNNPNKNNKLEILMVKKRYTYYYFNFVMGYYKKNNRKYLQFMFDNMTFDEKINILSFDYKQMWYKIYLFHIATNKYSKNKNYNKLSKAYIKKKCIFENNFLNNKKFLKKLICNAKHAVSPWEIPKGKRNANENDIDCAIREFKEETNVSKDQYNVRLNPITNSFKDENCIYKSVYYIATLQKNIEPSINIAKIHQISEVKDIKWINMDEIKFLRLNDKVKKNLIRLFKKIKIQYKKR